MFTFLFPFFTQSYSNKPNTFAIPHYYYIKMQFKSVVAALATVAAVQAAGNASNASNATNGTNGSGKGSSSISTGAAASNTLNAGIFGAAVAAGVAFLF